MNAASIKTRLKNQGKASGKIMDEMLLAYGFERTLYRISVSKYNERFILKGGMFLYALFNGTTPEPPETSICLPKAYRIMPTMW